MRRTSSVSFALVVGCVLASSGCHSSAPAAPALPGPLKSLDYALLATTIQLDQAALDALQSSAADGTLTFASTPSVLQGVQRGAVIVAGASSAAPMGLLRIVASADSSSGQLVMHTIGAPLQLAFQRLHLTASDSIASLASPGSSWNQPDLTPKGTGGASGTQSIDFLLFDGDGDPKTTYDQLRVHGDLGGSVDYDVGIDTDWGQVEAASAVPGCAEQLLTIGILGKCQLPSIKAHFYVTPSTSADVTFEGAAFASFKKKLTLASTLIAPGVITIGPLAFTVNLDVTATLSGQASASFQVGASASASLETGLDFDSDTGVSFKTPSPSFDFKPLASKVDLEAGAKVQVGPSLAFRLYDAIGPYAGIYAGASVKADLAKNPCFDLHAGIDADVGFSLTLPTLGTLFNESKQIGILDKSIATGSCTPPAGSSSLPPGAGPDAQHLASPTFTPWSRTLASPVGEMPTDDAQLAWMDVSRAIDGRWVLAGSGVDALTKLDDTGNLVWSKQYLDPDTASTAPAPYAMVRSLPTLDAGLFVVGEPYSLFEIGQAGGVVWASRFSPPGTISETGPNGRLTDQRTFQSVASDGAGGFWVAGSYEPTDADPSSIWLLHAGGDGSIQSSKLIGAGASGPFLYPTSLVAQATGVQLAGLAWDKASNGRQGFVASVGADGSVAWAERLPGCAGIGSGGMQISDARVLSSGDLLVAGQIDLGRRGVLAELGPTGAVRWASSPWANDALSNLTFSAVRELPTTGFLAVGNYMNHYDPDRLMLAALDVQGKVLWMKVYDQLSTESGTAADHKIPSLALTDEGGALVVGYTDAPTPSSSRNLWAFEAQAKDGAIAFTPGVATTLDFPQTTLACTMSPAALSLATQDFAVASQSFVPVEQPMTVQVTPQTP